jgi:hypothetical protein
MIQSMVRMRMMICQKIHLRRKVTWVIALLCNRSGRRMWGEGFMMPWMFSMQLESYRSMENMFHVMRTFCKWLRSWRSWIILHQWKVYHQGIVWHNMTRKCYNTLNSWSSIYHSKSLKWIKNVKFSQSSSSTSSLTNILLRETNNKEIRVSSILQSP